VPFLPGSTIDRMNELLNKARVLYALQPPPLYNWNKWNMASPEPGPTLGGWQVPGGHVCVDRLARILN
jgi:hypothetical protein